MGGGFGGGKKMKVNFNNLRRKACASLDAIIKELNSRDSVGGFLTLPRDTIRKDISELRSCLLALAFTYDEGNDDFKDIGDEVSIAWFGEENEE